MALNIPDLFGRRYKTERIQNIPEFEQIHQKPKPKYKFGKLVGYAKFDMEIHDENLMFGKARL